MDKIVLDICGWLGTFFFCVCGIPQAWKSYIEGHSDGLTWGFLLMLLSGEFLTVIYVWPTETFPYCPLLLNYTANIFLLLIMLRYKIWRRE